MFFFFNDTATTEIYTLSLHDALPILLADVVYQHLHQAILSGAYAPDKRLPSENTLAKEFDVSRPVVRDALGRLRSEEHTSELQSRQYLVCRLLLEKKKKYDTTHNPDS